MNDYADLWYEALRSPFGIALEEINGDLERARQRLYAARRETGDEDLDAISIVLISGEIWLVKRDP